MPLPLAGLATAALPMVTAALSQAQAGGKQAGQISKELLGYDFIGLLVKLAVFFGIAYAFAKFMEFVINGTGFFKWLFSQLGFVIQDVPQPLRDLFVTGYQGVKYWDLIKGMAIIMVGFEAYQYYRSNKDLGGQPSVMTLGIFGVIESALIVTTIPELISRVGGSKLQLSLSSGAVGTSFNVTVIGLKADTPATYGWKNAAGTVIFSKTVAIGQITGVSVPYTFSESVLATTAAGTYTIFFDQSAGGGPVYQATFTVLGGISA